MIKNIIEYFNETVINKGAKIAVVEGEKKITFRDLDRKSKILSSCIIDFIYDSNKPIAVFLPKTIISVITDIAITNSGNIYMNLDVKTPLDRINNIISLIEPKLIIIVQQVYKIMMGVQLIQLEIQHQYHHHHRMIHR